MYKGRPYETKETECDSTEQQSTSQIQIFKWWQFLILHVLTFSTHYFTLRVLNGGVFIRQKHFSSPSFTSKGRYPVRLGTGNVKR